jgi:hypothetical protein
MTKEQDSEGFKVTDKRMFREESETKPEETAVETPQENAPDRGNDPVQGRTDEIPPGTGAKIDFPSYVLSYYTQGLVLLGEVPNPYTNKKEEDMEAARHTIDILSMLEEKTKGNLGQEEAQLLESVLYELRIKFMAKTNRIQL